MHSKYVKTIYQNACTHFNFVLIWILNAFKEFRFISYTWKFSCFCVYFFKNDAATSENWIVTFCEMFIIFNIFLFYSIIIHQLHALSQKCLWIYVNFSPESAIWPCETFFAFCYFSVFAFIYDEKCWDFWASRGGVPPVWECTYLKRFLPCGIEKKIPGRGTTVPRGSRAAKRQEYYGENTGL